jgi:hypothetical protein
MDFGLIVEADGEANAPPFALALTNVRRTHGRCRRYSRLTRPLWGVRCKWIGWKVVWCNCGVMNFAGDEGFIGNDHGFDSGCLN